jgi:hypothetical protein
VLRAAGDLGLDPHLSELLAQEIARLRDVLLALGSLLGDEALDLVVLAGMKARERQVLQLPLDRMDPEPVRQRRVDLEGLTRLVELLLLGERLQGAHVVEAVGELDEDDPDVRGHRDHHLAVVLRLVLVAALEGDLRELGDPVHEPHHLIPEELAHLVEAGARVLDRVVEQGRAQRLGVEAQAGADLGDLDGMGDEVLSRAPPLVGVPLTREGERRLHGASIHRARAVLRVLGDNREEVAEEGALARRELLRQLVDGGGGRLRHAARAHARVPPPVVRPALRDRRSALCAIEGCLPALSRGSLARRRLALGGARLLPLPGGGLARALAVLSAAARPASLGGLSYSGFLRLLRYRRPSS